MSEFRKGTVIHCIARKYKQFHYLSTIYFNKIMGEERAFSLVNTISRYITPDKRLGEGGAR
jgi:hypothetical protein